MLLFVNWGRGSLVAFLGWPEEFNVFASFRLEHRGEASKGRDFSVSLPGFESALELFSSSSTYNP